MKALFAKVINVKAYPSTGIARVEIEAPVEQFRQIVELLHDKHVLVTIAPPMTGSYGVYESEKLGLSEAATAEKQSVGKTTVGPRCWWAVMRCKEEAFQEFLLEHFADVLSAEAPDDGEAMARWVVLKVCNVKSRAELDTNHAAGAMFDELIRKPYAQHAA